MAPDDEFQIAKFNGNLGAFSFCFELNRRLVFSSRSPSDVKAPSR